MNYDEKTRTLTVNGHTIVLPTDEEMARERQRAELDLENARAQSRQADINLANAQRHLDAANAEYDRTVARLKRASVVAFVCLWAGSLLLIAAAVMLWFGADIYPRRVAVGVVLGWLLLAPWAFGTWTGGRKE